MNYLSQLSIVVVFITLTGHSVAQHRVVDSAYADSPLLPSLLRDGKMVKLSADVVDLGILSQDDEPVVRTVKMVNVSDRTLELTRTNSSCGCVEIDVNPLFLTISDSSNIKIVFDPADQQGHILRTIAVFCSLSDTHPIARLSITSMVLPSSRPWLKDYPVAMGQSLRVKRSSLLVRAMTPINQRAERMVCFNEGRSSMKLTAKGLPDYIRFSTCPEVLPPLQEADLIVTIDGSHKDAKKLNQVFFSIYNELDDSLIGELEINIEWQK